LKDNPGASCAGQTVIQTLLDYYRMPAESLGAASLTSDSLSGEVGFFRCGAKNVCYGRSKSGVAADPAGSERFDALKDVRCDGKTIQLPFDFADVVENLRRERYRLKNERRFEKFATSEPIHKLYYFVREGLPVPARRKLQRFYFRDWAKLSFPAWPMDFTVDNLHQELLRLLLAASGAKKLPFIWFWPEGAPNCLIMTHDVETSEGRDFTVKLMDLDDRFGIKASYQVIPEKRYKVTDEYVSEIRSRGCELNIHDLNHDGNLYRERSEFLRRAARINSYAHRYDARGFRAGAMYRKPDWYDFFEFSYDMSVPNVAHLEPMRGGCCTVMPYFIGKIVELPLTTAQDYSVLHILNDYSNELWKRQLALLRERNGLMSLLTHPDYLIERRARDAYESLLDHVQQLVVGEKIWAALPGEVDRWWRARSQMRLVPRGDEWEIIGPEKARARLAYAVLEDHRLVYEFEKVPSCL
jgi:hypothetical protein